MAAKSCTQTVESGSSTVKKREEEKPHIVVNSKPPATHPRRMAAKSCIQTVESGSSTVKKREEEKPHIVVNSKPPATRPRRMAAKLCTQTVESGSSTVKKQEEEKPHIVVNSKPPATRPRRMAAKSCTQIPESGSSTVKKQEKEKPHIVVNPKPPATRPRRMVAKPRTPTVESGSSTVKQQAKEKPPHITADPNPRATRPTVVKSCTQAVESGPSAVKKQEKEKPPHITVDPKPRATRPQSRTPAVSSTGEKQEKEKPPHITVDPKPRTTRRQSRTPAVSSTGEKQEKEKPPHITVDPKPRTIRPTVAKSCTQTVESGPSAVKKQEKEKPPHITVDPKPRTIRPTVAKSCTQAVESGPSSVKKREKEKPPHMDTKPRATRPRSRTPAVSSTGEKQEKEKPPHITVDPKPRTIRPTVAKSCTQTVESGPSAVKEQEKEKPPHIDPKSRATRPQSRTPAVSSTGEKQEKEKPPHITVDSKPRTTRPTVAKSCTQTLESGPSAVKKQEKEKLPHITVDPKPQATRPQSRTPAVSSTGEKQEEQKPYITAEFPHHVGRTWRPLPIKALRVRPLPHVFSRNDQVIRAWTVLHETTSSNDAWKAYAILNEYAVPVYLGVLHRMVRLAARDRPRASAEFTRLLEILKQITFSGGKVYLHEWNALIAAAGRRWRKTSVRQYETALSFFRDMTKGQTPGTTLAIDAGSSDVEEKTTAEPLVPDIYTYTTLLGIAARTKDPKCLHHARMLLERSQIPPNRFTHLALVTYFSAVSQPGAVRSTLLTLERDNMELGLDGINALLSVYSKNQRLDLVTMIYRLLKHNLTPNLENVEEETNRLEEYRRQLRMEEFIVVPDYLVPNEATYTSLIQIMTYHGRLSTALRIFADMITAPNTERGAFLTRDADGVLRPTPYTPTPAIFRALFLGFRRHAKPLKDGAPLELKKRDVNSPDEWTLSNLQRVFDLFMSMPPTVQVATSYAPCLRHGPVALASSQTQPHFVRLGPCISNSMLHPRPNLTLFDPTSLRSVRSLYFQLNVKSQTQPHFVRLGLCISNSMLSPRPNLTSFG
ncbi:hypothetical protein E4T56_gene3786 [Termitomyces sp. T112]|nr:hypothetical protein E4T56_gene3786 [Termitomyces sp. T112]